MNTVLIREAVRRDVAAITALWKEMMDFHGAQDPRFRFSPDATREFERHLVATLKSRGARVFVAEKEGQVVGYILGEIHVRKPIYPAGKYGFISDICVTARWRRHGIGRALLERLLAWFLRNDVTAIELFVAEANPVSAAFWEAMGFSEYLRMLRLDLDKEAE